MLDKRIPARSTRPAKPLVAPVVRALRGTLPRGPGASQPDASEQSARPAPRGHALAAAARSMWRDRERIKPTARRSGRSDRGTRSAVAGGVLDRSRRTRRARALVGGAAGRLAPRGR
jgi:hypothetical protein